MQLKYILKNIYLQTQLLDQQEVTFWKKFIKKYLSPIDKDVEKEKKIAKDLKVKL